MNVKRDRYDVTRVYIVACKECNEDIGRPVTGEDVKTMTQVQALLKEHEKVFHGNDQ